MTPAQLATLKNELQTDPRGLGYNYLSGNDSQMANILNWVRDGATPCPDNSIIGPAGVITGASNATPIVLTTSVAHGLATGDAVLVAGVGGNTAANGTFAITVVNATRFSLNGSVGNAAYTSGGTWNWCVYLRNPSVVTQQILGAIAPADVSATTLTTQEQIILSGLMNDGSIALVNADGSDNNNVKHIKKLVASPSASLTAIIALENDNYGRIAQLFGQTASASATDVGIALNS